jgi:hypothetical protein
MNLKLRFMLPGRMSAARQIRPANVAKALSARTAFFAVRLSGRYTPRWRVVAGHGAILDRWPRRAVVGSVGAKEWPF